MKITQLAELKITPQTTVEEIWQGFATATMRPELLADKEGQLYRDMHDTFLNAFGLSLHLAKTLGRVAGPKVAVDIFERWIAETTADAPGGKNFKQN